MVQVSFSIRICIARVSIHKPFPPSQPLREYQIYRMKHSSGQDKFHLQPKDASIYPFLLPALRFRLRTADCSLSVLGYRYGWHSIIVSGSPGFPKHHDKCSDCVSFRSPSQLVSSSPPEEFNSRSSFISLEPLSVVMPAVSGFCRQHQFMRHISPRYFSPNQISP